MGLPLFASVLTGGLAADLYNGYKNRQSQKQINNANLSNQNQINSENNQFAKTMAQNSLLYQAQQYNQLGLNPQALAGSQGQMLGGQSSVGFGQQPLKYNTDVMSHVLNAVQLESMQLDNAYKKKQLDDMNVPHGTGSPQSEIPSTIQDKAKSITPPTDTTPFEQNVRSGFVLHKQLSNSDGLRSYLITPSDSLTYGKNFGGVEKILYGKELAERILTPQKVLDGLGLKNTADTVWVSNGVYLNEMPRKSWDKIQAEKQAKKQKVTDWANSKSHIGYGYDKYER